AAPYSVGDPTARSHPQAHTGPAPAPLAAAPLSAKTNDTTRPFISPASPLPVPDPESRMLPLAAHSTLRRPFPPNAAARGTPPPIPRSQPSHTTSDTSPSRRPCAPTPHLLASAPTIRIAV